MNHDGIVYTIIRRSNRVLLLCALIAALLLAIAGAWQWRFFYNGIFGPFPMSAAEATTVSNPDQLQKYYVTIHGDDIVDTGYSYTSEDNGIKTTEAMYWAMLLGDHLMLVKTKESHPGATLTGTLQPISGEERTEVIDGINKDVPDIKPFISTLLEVSDLRSNVVMISAAMGVCWAICLVLMLLALYRGVSPETHPIYKALGRLGDPTMIVAQIDQEMSTAHTTAGGLHITTHWLASTGLVNLSAMRLNDVVWYYKRVTQMRYYGIPTNKKYALVVYDRNGRLVVLNGNDGQIDTAVQALVQGAPWAIGGYNTELKAQWINAKTRPAFIEAVDQRRRSQS